jgi:hypothetical protein
MYICNLCGELVEEVPTEVQCHGYTSLGQPINEVIDSHCHCGGEFVEAKQCEICGEWFDNTELNGVCEVCLEEHETVEEALNFGDENEVEISGINGAVAFLLSAEQINKILKKWVEENFVDHSKDIIEYCEDDFCEFSEYLADKYGE